MRARFVTASVVQAATCLAGSTAKASDTFEIQVYDGTANAPGVPGIELHLNDWATGNRTSTLPEVPLHGQFHATLEPSLGVLPFWEVGAYLQGALRDDGELDWAGAKIRSKFVTPPGWDAHWRLGVNLELAYLPPAFDRDRWGVEIRPIAAWQNEDWLFVINPIVGQALAGVDSSRGPSFEPAAKVARFVGPIGMGIEYYGTIRPFFSPPPIREQEHYLYEVVDILSLRRIELNFGIGEGLTEQSAGIVLKAIVGYTFEPDLTPNQALSTGLSIP